MRVIDPSAVVTAEATVKSPPLPVLVNVTVPLPVAEIGDSTEMTPDVMAISLFVAVTPSSVPTVVRLIVSLFG